MADREAAPKTGRAMVVGLYPDVRKVGSSTIAQDIVAVEGDDTTHSTDVKITSCWASNHGARLSTVTPPAPGGGVVSGVGGGYARPLSDTSSTVLINGQGCTRHGTVYEMNCAGPEGPSNTLGTMVYAPPTRRFGPHGPAAYTPPSASPTVALTAEEQAMLAAFAAEGAPPGTALPPTAGPTAPEPLGLGGQVWGGVKGLGRGAWNMATGTVEMAGKTAQYVTDGVLGGPVDLVTGGRYDYEWLPSARRARATEQAVIDTGRMIAENPRLVWDAMTEEVVGLWNEGKYGEAIGLGSFEVLSAVLGPKGANKIGKLAKLSDSELRALADKGVIDADEMRAAMARRDGEDGVTIHGDRGRPDPAVLARVQRMLPGFPAETQRIIALSPDFVNRLEEFEGKDWRFVTADLDGAAGFAHQGEQLIEVGRDLTPAQQAFVLGHEVGHAIVPAQYVPPTGLTRAEYIRQNVRQNMYSEGFAQLTGHRLNDLVMANGGPDIASAFGESASTQIFRDYASGAISQQDAIWGLAQDMAARPVAGAANYLEYYGNHYANFWDTSIAPTLP